MENGIKVEKAIDLSILQEALSSSSTKVRGVWLANLRQQIVESGRCRYSLD